MHDNLLFAVFPYLAIALFLIISITRYRSNPFSFSSLSSQFLESRRLFWGSVPFHVGIILIFFGHVLGFLIPDHIIAWNREPMRLMILETTGFAAALLCLVGLCGLIYRRMTSDRLRANTSVADIGVYIILMFQIVTGLWVAMTLRWGSSWYAEAAVPYLWSILSFDPQIANVVALPLAAKLHIIGAWVLFAAFSFTRLVHVLVAPVPYLWRPLQLVIWNRLRPHGN